MSTSHPDRDALREQLQNEKLALQGYLDHPFTKRILEDSAEEQEKLVDLLTNVPIHSIETFFAHFEAIGHLRGLRSSKVLLLDGLSTIEAQLKALDEE